MRRCQVISNFLCFGCGLAACFVSVAQADEEEKEGRRFTYVYEATTEEPGEVESETWTTWKTSPANERRFNAADFRHEIEFGVTEHLQVAIYLADWGYREDPNLKEHGFRYQDSALELIYNLTNPRTDLLGLALYGEVRGGPEQLELESKIILQKNFRRFVAAYNGTLEVKWEGERLEEKGGELSQSLGLSYEISPGWSLGGGIALRDRSAELVGGGRFDRLWRSECFLSTRTLVGHGYAAGATDQGGFRSGRADAVDLRLHFLIDRPPSRFRFPSGAVDEARLIVSPGSRPYFPPA